MTLYFETESNVFHRWSGEPIDEIQHPRIIEQVWSEPELEAVGLFKPAPADPAPEGKIVIETSIQRIDGVVKFVHTLEDAPAPSTDPADYPLLPWQFKAMVDYLGKDIAIRDAIALIEDPLKRAASLSRYLNASSYEFNDPLMQSAREAVGMSAEDLAAAWMLAKDLRSTPV